MADTAGVPGSGAAQGQSPLNEQQMMEQLMMQMMIFGPFMEMMEEDREDDE